MCAVRNKVRPADVNWLNCCQISLCQTQFFLAPPAASLTFAALLVPLDPSIIRHENPFSPRRQAVALTDPSPFFAAKKFGQAQSYQRRHYGRHYVCRYRFSFLHQGKKTKMLWRQFYHNLVTVLLLIRRIRS